MNGVLNILYVFLFIATNNENVCSATEYTYEIQILKSMRPSSAPARTRSRHSHPKCKKGFLPMDDFPEEVQRTQDDFAAQSVRRKMEICAEVVRLDFCRQHKIKLLYGSKPGRGKKFKIRIAGVQKFGPLDREIKVWAFRCPTRPPLYLRLNGVDQPVRVMIPRNHNGYFLGTLRANLPKPPRRMKLMQRDK